MDLYCTRPGCPRPVNHFPDLDDSTTLRSAQQKFCTSCGMPLLLVGRYLTQKLLGQGGFGAAFLARDRYTPAMRPCVVKQFQPSGNLTAAQLLTAQGLFEREAVVLEELGNAHPQIPDLLAFFDLTVTNWPGGQRQDKFFYLVQEFIDGQTLEEELAQQGPFSEAAVVEVLREILKVLEFVHTHDSIHRDIKPSNIMRHRNGLLYLLDFGAVRQATKGGGSGRSTGIYSTGYAPPEQMQGSEVYPSTDLYALAMTCLVLLTGKEPADLYDSYQNTWKWRSYANVSDRLAAVLDRLLLPSPGQRFQSAAEVLAALAPPVPRPASAPASAPAPAPAPPAPRRGVVVKSPLTQPGAAVPTRTPFSILEVLGNAAFWGAESALLAIGLFSLPLPSLVSGGLWLLLAGGMVLAQSRRIIERIDLLLLLAGTLGLVIFFPILHGVLLAPIRAGFSTWQVVLLVAAFSGLMAVAVTTVFRLLYALFSLFP